MLKTLVNKSALPLHIAVISYGITAYHEIRNKKTPFHVNTFSCTIFLFKQEAIIVHYFQWEHNQPGMPLVHDNMTTNLTNPETVEFCKNVTKLKHMFIS